MFESIIKYIQQAVKKKPNKVLNDKNVTNNISARRILKADQQVPEENASLGS